jgi:hypothetical protein
VDFALEEVGSDIPVRPESATIVAAKLEKQKNSTSIEVYPHGTVGYGSGTSTIGSSTVALPLVLPLQDNYSTPR